ncbi:MAG TPA: hypothetical protein DEO84_07735 [candidate division Zixibacteria bacterium]|nr:hypothetical protein [candidate division Zixibacteria bacterium]
MGFSVVFEVSCAHKTETPKTMQRAINIFFIEYNLAKKRIKSQDMFINFTFELRKRQDVVPL